MGAISSFSTVFPDARVETIDGETFVTCAEHAGAYVRMVGAGILRTYFCEPNHPGETPHVLYISQLGATEEKLKELKLRTEQELLPAMYREYTVRREYTIQPGQPEHEV